MALTEGADQPHPASDKTDRSRNKIARYLNEIAYYEKETRTWAERRKKIIKRYKDERSPREDADVRFNILWSMVQTLKPALLAKTPKPDIQRRFKDADPIGRVASDVLERAVTYFVQECEFYEAMRQDVEDYILLGRGTAWVRYVPTFKDAPEIEVTGDEGKEGETDEPEQVLDFEEVQTDFVHAEDFGHNICRTWEEVWMVWRRVHMDRAEQVKRFGTKKGNLPPLDAGNRDQMGRFTGNIPTKSVIYELWDKKRNIVLWFHKDIPEALDVRDDPLGLDDFFPCPKPLYATIANDSLIPVPDYYEWQDQAVELDSLTARIGSVQKALRVAGVYDASAQGISRLLAEGVENQLIPVESWALFAEKGGIKGAIDFLPLEDIANGLVAMFEAREKIKNDLYEITGIADIIRGQSDPQETMGAQQIKANFATMRLSDRQDDVQRFIRNVIKLMVDVIANHFDIETIKQISGVRLFTQDEKAQLQALAGSIPPPQSGQTPGVQPSPAQPQMSVSPPPPSGGVPAVAPSRPLPPFLKGLTPDQIDQMTSDPTWEEVETLIRNRPMRSFRIDIETDSTIRADEIQDRQQRLEFLQAASGFLQQAVPAGAQAPEAVPLLMNMLMFGIRAFPVGKEMEGQFESTAQKLEKKAQILQSQPPQPNPEMIKIQGQLQLEQAKAQSDQQAAQARVQADAQIAQQRMQADAQSEQRENELEHQRELAKIQAEGQLEQFKAQMSAKTEEETAHIRAAAQVEVARITAGLSSGEDFETREVEFETKDASGQPTTMRMSQNAAAQQNVANAMTQLIQHLAAQGQQMNAHQQQMADMHRQHQEQMGHLINAHAAAMGRISDAMSGEREIVRDEDGRAKGMRIKSNGAMH